MSVEKKERSIFHHVGSGGIGVNNHWKNRITIARNDTVQYDIDSFV